jgi:uncharacterized iron-regulated membrane protein
MPGGARRFWVATHRYLGLATLAFLALAAITGCLLCFRAPLDAALNPDLFRRVPGSRTIDPAAAVRALQLARPRLRVLSFPLRLARDANLPVSVAPNGQVFLDGTDGHVVGTRRTLPGWDRRRLMEGVHAFHYTLLGGDWGRWLMGLAALGWLMGACIGLYLTFPSRGPLLRGWIKAWTVKTNSRLPRLLLDLHQASGLWLLIAVIVVAATSVALNLFDEVIAPAATAMSPARPSPFDRPALASPGAPRIDFARALGAAVARARERGLAWRPAAASYNPDHDLYGVTFTRNGAVDYRGLGPVSYYFDAGGGRFVYEDNPYQDSFGRKATRAIYPLHTGQVIGGAGVALVFLVGLATVGMCFTGAYVWWVRRGPRIAARKVAG